MAAPYKLVDAFLQLPQLFRRTREQKIDPNIAKWFKPGDAVLEPAWLSLKRYPNSTKANEPKNLRESLIDSSQGLYGYPQRILAVSFDHKRTRDNPFAAGLRRCLEAIRPFCGRANERH
jgi:hypothetical protein